MAKAKASTKAKSKASSGVVVDDDEVERTCVNKRTFTNTDYWNEQRANEIMAQITVRRPRGNWSLKQKHQAVSYIHDSTL